MSTPSTALPALDTLFLTRAPALKDFNLIHARWWRRRDDPARGATGRLVVAAHRGFPFPLSLLPNRLQRILGRVPALAARLRGAPPSTRQCPETLCAHDALSSAMAPWLGTVEDATGMGVIFCEAWIMRPTLAPAPHTLTSLSSDLQRLRLGLPSSRSGARGACYVEALFEGDRLVECVFDGPEDFMEAAPATLTAWGQRHRRFLREIGRLRLATTLAPLSAHDLAKLLTAGRT